MPISQVLCGTIDDPSIDLVEQAHAQYSDYANSAMIGALNAVDNLQQFVINPYEFNVSFRPSEAWWSVTRPQPIGAAPTAAFDPGAYTVPEAPSTSIDVVALDEAPTFDAVAPTLPQRAEPSALAVDRPQRPDTPAAPEFPDAPDTTLPPKPDLIDTNALLPDRIQLRDIAVPTLDDIGDLPPRPDLQPITPIPALREVLFTGVKPIRDFDAPPNTFSFTPEIYTSVLKGKIEASLSFMLDGGTGLPWAVVQALRDRAYKAEDVQERRGIQTALEEYSSRGFDEPSGILNRRLAEQRQLNQNNRSALSRDIYIEDEKIAVENMRFAVTQGVALESALSQAHVDRMRIALDAARASAQVGIDLFNARAAVFNLELQAYQTDAQVFGILQNAAVEELRGHIARTDAELRANGQLIDIWSATLNGLRIRVDINTGRVSLYEAQNRADQLRVQLYSAEVEAVNVVGSQNVQRVQLFGEQARALLAGVQVYSSTIDAANKKYDGALKVFDVFEAEVRGLVAEVGAKNAEWEGFGAQINADVARLRPYELYSNVFANRVDAWSKGTQAKIEQQRLQRDGKALDIQAYGARLDAIRTTFAYEGQRVGSEVDIYRGGIDRYRAEADVERSVSEGNERIFQASLAQQRVQVETAFRNIDLQLQQMLANATLTAENLKTIAVVRSNLASAAMSAVNFSASVGSSYGQSVSCGTSVGYSTDLTEANA